MAIIQCYMMLYVFFGEKTYVVLSQLEYAPKISFIIVLPMANMAINQGNVLVVSDFFLSHKTLYLQIKMTGKLS